MQKMDPFIVTCVFLRKENEVFMNLELRYHCLFHRAVGSSECIHLGKELDVAPGMRLSHC